MDCGLTKNLIQYSAMGLGKGQKFLRIHRYIGTTCTARWRIGTTSRGHWWGWFRCTPDTTGSRGLGIRFCSASKTWRLLLNVRELFLTRFFLLDFPLSIFRLSWSGMNQEKGFYRGLQLKKNFRMLRQRKIWCCRKCMTIRTWRTRTAWWSGVSAKSLRQKLNASQRGPNSSCSLRLLNDGSLVAAAAVADAGVAGGAVEVPADAVADVSKLSVSTSIASDPAAASVAAVAVDEVSSFFSGSLTSCTVGILLLAANLDFFMDCKAASLSWIITFRTRRKNAWLEVLLVKAFIEGNCSSAPPLTLLGAWITTAWLVKRSITAPLPFFSVDEFSSEKKKEANY